MTLLPESVGELSRSEKQALLRKVLLERISRVRTVPASFAQEGLWFLHRLRPDSPVYNLSRALRLRGALDVPALERALGEIVRRHEALRTTFAATETGEPVQVIAPYGGFALAAEDLSGPDGPGREAKALRRAAAEAARPFDLSSGPLFRATLLRLGHDDHVLLLCMHHVVSDGWSMGVLFRELAALYGAYRDGSESPLPEPAAQYADHALRQREELRGDALERELAWWRERLAGAPALLELPADRPRLPAQSFRGARERLELSAGLAERLRSVGRGQGATLYMVLLGAFQALLAKYAGTDDVVVGTIGAGRTRPELQGVVGYFAHTLVLRTDLSGDPGFRELLRRAREVALRAYEHQEVPFDRLVAELRPERTLAWSPLFQVLFELREGLGARPALPGLEVTHADPEPETTKFDLSLTFDVEAGGFHAMLDYATDLFEPGTVRRMARHLERVLEQVAADPDVRLSKLELMDAGERALVVREWNRTEAAPPAESCIHELFERQVDRTPDAIAVVFAGETLTCAELDAAANRLAHHLRGLGIGPEDRVALCMERAPELMVAFFGILKAGAAFVPLEPTHPADRLAYMLEDSGARLLVTQSWLADRLPQARPETLCIDRMAAELASGPAERPESGVGPRNLAYVYYTSGSTGRPKGVLMHHEGPVNYFAWARGEYLSAGGRGAPVFSSMAVDLTLASFVPLFAGQPVELLAEGPGVEALAEALRRRPWYAMIKITPTHLSLLNQVLAPQDAARAAGALVIGADSLMAEPTLFWREHAPGVRLLNEYGPTETVVGCSLYEIPVGRHVEGRIPFGRPIQNLTHYVLDAWMQPVPVGVAGELYIGGIGVARGYLGRPGLTAEKFVPDPFAARPGARFYRTGDRVRWLEESAEVRECVSAEVGSGSTDSRTNALTHSRTGVLEFLGRIDFQVKVRGYRIELGEIEARLREHPGVRHAVVLVREDTPGDTRLVAYVVGDETADVESLRAHLGERLPRYMVPAAYVRLEQLPLGRTGKLDRRALPAPGGDAFVRGGYEAPVGEVEEALAEIWAEVLGIERVGRRDHFFELGGHSLLAVELVERMRRRGLHAEVRALFTTPAFADFAASTDQLLELRL